MHELPKYFADVVIFLTIELNVWDNIEHQMLQLWQEHFCRSEIEKKQTKDNESTTQISW